VGDPSLGVEGLVVVVPLLVWAVNCPAGSMVLLVVVVNGGGVAPGRGFFFGFFGFWVLAGGCCCAPFWGRVVMVVPVTSPAVLMV
jgi:hypothetical protein